MPKQTHGIYGAICLVQKIFPATTEAEIWNMPEKHFKLKLYFALKHQRQEMEMIARSSLS